MKIYTSAIEQQEQEQKQEMQKQWNRTHHAKKEDHHHNTINGISYSEYNCGKLNGYRADDRPYGNEERKRWRCKGMANAWTYSKKQVKEWTSKGLEVWEYTAKGELANVYNPTRATIDFLNKYNIQMA